LPTTQQCHGPQKRATQLKSARLVNDKVLALFFSEIGEDVTWVARFCGP
jgi:hypothetical protein